MNQTNTPWFKTLFVCLTLSLGIPFANTLKIAHVDSKVIFAGLKETKSAQADYDNQVSRWEQQAADMQAQLTEMKDKIEKQSLMLSNAKKKELQENFVKKQAEYQQFVQKIYGRGGELFQKNEEFSGPIIEKIKKTVQEIAAQEGYDMVLDRATGAVVFWKSSNDLTDKVLKLLNKE
jgi:outer membrane protein